MDPIQPEPQKETPREAPKETPKQDRVQIKSLRTYQGDVDEAMSKNKFSATTIFVAEQKRRIETPRVETKPIDLEARNKFFTILGISLLSLGILVVFAVYYVRSNEEITIEKRTKALVEFSTEKSMPIASSTRDEITSRILSEKTSWKQPVNSVLYLNTTESGESEQNLDKFLSSIAPNMPASLKRAFEKKYMVGILSYDTNEPFIILTTKDFPSAYAGMLKWEKDIPTDLGKIFEITAEVGTTTRIFYDEAIRNKDLRILRDRNKKTTLVYSFIDKNTLVITKNETIFNAILAKYLVSQNTR